MKVKYADYSDFKGKNDRMLWKRGRRISLILPARNEHKTVGDYFPHFSGLMDSGCIDEVVIADNSDDSRTISVALESALDTPAFADSIFDALRRESTLPVKAVSVFDHNLSGIFNGHKPKRGTPPGKGTAMYLGMAVATGDILLFLDTDFHNIDSRFVYGLVGPFLDPHTVLSKATFELEDVYENVVDECVRDGRDPAQCDTLLKSVNSRTLAKPLTGIIEDSTTRFPGISRFRGPLSGGCGAPMSAWHSIMVPQHYGTEISYLMQFMSRYSDAHVAYDVNLGEVVQESQDHDGRIRMGTNIIATVMHHLCHYLPEFYSSMSENPEIFVDRYVSMASRSRVHSSDDFRIRLYAEIMKDVIERDDIHPVIFPPLERNVYYWQKRGQIRHHADCSTADRLEETGLVHIGKALSVKKAG
jgi:glucosyl-3-phosphoglycerate synthase